MDTLFKTPDAVRQAKQAQKGMHLALEILVFVAVFFVCTIGEVVVLLPVEFVLLGKNQLYLDAVATGDLDLISEAAQQALSADAYTQASLFATAVMMGLVFLFCRLLQKRKLTTLGFVKEGCGKEYAKGIVIGFALFSAAVFLCVLTGAVSLTGADTFTVSGFLLFTAGFMVQGMAEEVLCRGYFMVSVGRRYPMWVAAVVNAVAFAALHLLNPGISPLAIVNLVLFGIFASVCFIQTENIWMIGAIHSVWNLVQGNVYGIKVSGMQTGCTALLATMTEGKELINGGAFGLEGGLAVTAALLAGIAGFYVYSQKQAASKL